MLAVFLALISINFLGVALSEITHEPIWLAFAYVALALDPFYLYLLVTIHPYRRSPPWKDPAIFVLGATSLVALVLLLAAPLEAGRPRSAAHAWIIGNMALGYLLSWSLAIRNLVTAPTPLLARRASWIVAAVGVAVLPRLAAIYRDFEWSPIMAAGLAPPETVRASGSAETFLRSSEVIIQLLGALAILGISYWWASRRGRAAAKLREAFRLAVWVLFALFLAQILLDSYPEAPFRNSLVFPIRWIVFSLILVYGIVSYQVVEFERGVIRAASHMCAALGSLALAIFCYAVTLNQSWPPAAVGAITVALAGGSFMPFEAAIRRLFLRRRRATGAAPGDRRLELYRAALESAWARGAPTAEDGRQLGQLRRKFGISADEANALDHVVQSQLGPQPTLLKPGDEPLPGYVIERSLGEGGHGRVFLARHEPSGKQWALKEMAGSAGGHEQRRALLQESAALERLSHPNIVRFRAVEHASGRHIVLEEYIDGETLQERLSRGPLSSSEALDLARQTLDALNAAHSNGVVHSDVTPSNLLLGRDGRVRLADFGLACLARPTGLQDVTARDFGSLGGFEGRLFYAPPDRLARSTALPSDDLYSLAMTIVESLGARPARTWRATPDARGRLSILTVPLGLRKVPAPWRAFLQRALDPDPARRFPDAADMRRALSEPWPPSEDSLMPGKPGPSGPRPERRLPGAAASHPTPGAPR